jgi:hypothetical protein
MFTPLDDNGMRVRLDRGRCNMVDKLSPRELTAEEIAAFDEADALLIRAFDEARAKVSDFHGGDKLGGRCIRCNTCDYFIPENPDVIAGSEAPYLGCMRLGCNHLLTSHVLPPLGP